MQDKIVIKTKYQEYEIKIIENLQVELSGYSKILVISNVVVAKIYMQDLLNALSHNEVYTHILPDGEEFKNWQSIESILNKAFDSKLDRSSLMVALGGGVISDMVGFASGIYERGIDFISFPTTLLAQVDASVGGKTGINTSYGKNLIGLFYQPKAVYIYMNFLSTLPKREFASGIAEIIKIAICFDEEFFNFLEQSNLNHLSDLKRAVLKSIELKARVVELDEKEKGIRAALNYGHTFGHVIESLGKFKQFLHGEAVAIGMQMANELAYSLGFLNQEEVIRINKLLQQYGLDFKYYIEDVEQFYECFFLDKKTRFSQVCFVLPYHLGHYILKNDIDRPCVVEVLKKWA